MKCGKVYTILLDTGLKRCGNSCRLRWLNYLRPDIKRGNISPAEEDLIIRLHRLLGNRSFHLFFLDQLLLFVIFFSIEESNSLIVLML